MIDVAAFHRDGFLVLADVVPVERCAALRARMDELVAGFDPDETLPVFSTDEQVRTADDEHFLSSGGAIRYFLEEEAVADGRLTVPFERAINKVGHALHDLDPVFDAFCRAPEVRAVVEALGPAEPRLLQSMYIFKHPGIGGEVTLHQDATFLYTEPGSTLGLWFALEDADVDNGCLWALPGGHRLPVRRRMRRADGGGVTFDELDPTPLPTDGMVPLPASTGTVIALHGRLPHGSAANRSARSRHAFTLHVVDGTADYPADNWLQRDEPLRGF